VGPIRAGLTPYYRPHHRKWKRIGKADLERAATILIHLEEIYSHANTPQYKRLRKGFNVWVRAAEESLELSERLHAFIRSSEAMIKPTITVRRRRTPVKNTLKTVSRPITETFISRGQTFIGHSKANQRLLKQFYNIRSSVEHIKDIMPRVKQARGIAKQEAVVFRALQCELLASDIYSRILSSEKLMECFSTERRVEGFWSRTEAKRRLLWGEPLSLHAKTVMEFFSHITAD
jgi:hypothetical protein